jgi:hypothetical protein
MTVAQVIGSMDDAGYTPFAPAGDAGGIAIVGA